MKRTQVKYRIKQVSPLQKSKRIKKRAFFIPQTNFKQP